MANYYQPEFQLCSIRPEVSKSSRIGSEPAFPSLMLFYAYGLFRVITLLQEHNSLSTCTVLESVHAVNPDRPLSTRS